ncbi:unnamed protein product [Brassicogethes aeneus]|uniref:Codanin-1 C-terminal domain-containing protein n=1 Tax=Brassicogethes aeneus TaxID=1431903 RepID=A0A9P0FCN9_BRAAE|nr:unnamed protein product [Brassicogethes aeneus]
MRQWQNVDSLNFPVYLRILHEIMADILLNKLINEEIDIRLFLSWLSNEETDDDKYSEINGYCAEKCSFVTYFLNFLHEDLPCNDFFGKTPQKLNTPKRIDTKITQENSFGRRQSLFCVENNDKSYDLNKSSSLPLNLNKSIECKNNLDVSTTSTPKVTKLINNSLEASYLSPISPLYKKDNFSTPKHKKSELPGKSPLCLGDFIVTKRIGKKKTPKSLNLDDSSESRTKRITPTTLCQKKVNNRVRETENSFNFQNISEESEINRSFIAEERKKILTRKNSVEFPIKKITSNLLNLNIEGEISLNLVTNADKLVIFVDIYVLFLKKNWVLNITSEVYFIVSLLLSKNCFVKENKCDSGNMSCENVGVEFLKDENAKKFNLDLGSKKKQFYNSEIFENVNNIIYFAVKCLENVTELLEFYDKSTLKLLSDNKRLNKFSPDLKEKILKIYETKNDRMVEISPNNTQTNICFNLDTDNKENFPSTNSFQSFRKQRDLFYEILRIWENNHMLQGWNFQVSLSGKIKSLLSLGSDPVNFVHFSRLFKQQLLTTCGTSHSDDASEVPFLPSLPNLDAEKFSRLKSRLVTKQNSNGLNSLPFFSGHQEFYKEFIVTGGHHTFNKHLGDSLITEILELNSSKFDGIDPDQDIDCTTKKSYLACLKSLRTLAKFLGFLESLPYNAEVQHFPENILNLQIKVRSDVYPNFDVNRILKNSIIERKVVLSVPWIVKYLAMLDYVTLRLPYFRDLFAVLFNLYKNYNGTAFNTSLIKISLGWLFELPSFPDTDFFNHIDGTKENPQKTENKSKKSPLDSLDIVDQNILYICCPYLSELKKLLTNNTTQSHVTVKHITPVTAVKSSNDIAKKKLEYQLEEAFFNGQPMSTRKTVEFVSERVASTCVKHICNTIVPNFKKNALKDLRKITEEWKNKTETLSEEETNIQKNVLKQETNKLLQKNLENLKQLCLGEVTDAIKQKIPKSVENLLALDTLLATRDTCIAIATRTCLERVSHWVNVHVTSAIFGKDFDGELQKTFSETCCQKSAKDKPVFLLPPGGNNRNHDDLTFSSAQILEKMTILATSIIEGTVTIDEEFTLNFLKESLKTLTERGDVNECIKSYICTILVDISLLLITHHTKLMTNRTIMTNFALIWKTYHANPDNLFKNMISPRNIMLLAQSQNKVNSWDTLARFLAFLMKEKLMESDTFEAQVTAIFRNEWDQGTLKNLTTFIKTFVFCHRDSGGCVSQFTLLLEFLSEMCVDLNNC